MDWQPIATAPRNGADDAEDLLMWNGYVFIGWLGNDEKWHSANYDRSPEDPQPTHWMPLPPPPR